LHSAKGLKFSIGFAIPHDPLRLREEFAPLDTQDYSSFISTISDADPDAALYIFSGTPAVRMLSQSRNFGLLESTHVSGTTLAQTDHMRPLGEDMRGVTSFTRYSYAWDQPGNIEWVSNYIQENNKAPQIFTASAHQALEGVRQVIEEAGTIETEAFIDTFEDFQWSDPFGEEFHMRACDHQNKNTGHMVEVVPSDEFDSPFDSETQGILDNDLGVNQSVLKTFDPETIMRSCEETAEAGCDL